MAREEVSLLLSRWLLRCEVRWKEVSSRLMWFGMKIERESWVFVSEYGPSTEKSEEEMGVFWNVLNECVGNFGRYESVV